MMGVPPGMNQPRRGMTSAGFGQPQQQQQHHQQQQQFGGVGSGMGRAQQQQSHFPSMTTQQQQQSQFLMGRASQNCYGTGGGWSSPSQNNWSTGPPANSWGHRGPMNSGARGSGMGGPGPAAMAAATAAAMAQRNKLFGSSSNAGFPQNNQQYVQNRMKKPVSYSAGGMKPTSMDMMGNDEMHQVSKAYFQ